MKNSKTHIQYSAVERNNQLVLILNSEIKLPKDAPVRVTSAQLEELDYRKLYAAYSSRGKIGHRPASDVQGNGIRIPMRYLFQSKVGGSLPISGRFYVASGK